MLEYVVQGSGSCRRSPEIGERVAMMLTKNTCTIDMITTHGKLSDETIAWAREVLPLPEEPAMPMMLVSAHGGE